MVHQEGIEMSFSLVDVPVGVDGDWEIDRIVVDAEGASKSALHAQIAAYQGRREFPVPEGSYTRLRHHSQVVMSDTPSEMFDHAEFLRVAEGRVFIAGLGIGMVLQGVLNKPTVKHVTVVELSENVLRLVAPHYQAKFGRDRLTILQGDATFWTPPRGTHKNPFDAAWFDIWNDKCADNLDDISKIKKRWFRWAKWRGFWAEDQIRAYQRRRR